MRTEFVLSLKRCYINHNLSQTSGLSTNCSQLDFNRLQFPTKAHLDVTWCHWMVLYKSSDYDSLNAPSANQHTWVLSNCRCTQGVPWVLSFSDFGQCPCLPTSWTALPASCHRRTKQCPLSFALSCHALDKRRIMQRHRQCKLLVPLTIWTPSLHIIVVSCFMR